MGQPNRTARVRNLADRAPASRTDVHGRKVAEPQGLTAVRIVGLDVTTRRVILRVGGTEADAAIDAAVSTTVLETALARGERVVAQHEAGEWVVLGALRTVATPGDYVISARRLRVEADHELSLKAGTQSLVISAARGIELLAEDITARAAHVFKLIGRTLRLN